MGMIEADNTQAAIACLALHVDEFFRGDPVASTGRLATRIRAPHDLADQVVDTGYVTKQNSATLVGIGQLAMSANRIEIVLRQYQHPRLGYSSARPEVTGFRDSVLLDCPQCATF